MDSLNTLLAIIASCLAIVGTILGIRLTLLQLRSHSLSPPSSSPSPVQSRAAPHAPSHSLSLQELEDILKKSESQVVTGILLAIIVGSLGICGMFSWLHNIYGSWTRLGLLFNNWNNLPGVFEGMFLFFGLPLIVTVLLFWIVYRMTSKFIQRKTYGKFKNESEVRKEVERLKQQHVP